MSDLDIVVMEYIIFFVCLVIAVVVCGLYDTYKVLVEIRDLLKKERK